ncbi:MAG: RES family NAD+ phosphorylase [Ramlibacter sp.]
MTPFAPRLGTPVQAWRVDQAVFRATWDSATGAHALGGRWNPKGVKALYCSLDASTAILEVAVHKGFRALDKVPHVITALKVDDPASVFVVKPQDVPNPAWLRAGMPSAGQQEWGAELLAKHLFVAIPSVVSQHSWNLVFDPDRAVGAYRQLLQEPLSIDTRLNPPAS